MGDAPRHFCDALDEDDEGFVFGVCSCGWRTFSVPSTDLAVDELMAHAVDAALSPTGQEGED